jgi:hypothetical protein
MTAMMPRSPNFKLGEALEKRGVAAHIFESAAEAQADRRNIEAGAGVDFMGSR